MGRKDRDRKGIEKSRWVRRYIWKGWGRGGSGREENGRGTGREWEDNVKKKRERTSSLHDSLYTLERHPEKKMFLVPGLPMVSS